MSGQSPLLVCSHFVHFTSPTKLKTYVSSCGAIISFLSWNLFYTQTKKNPSFRDYFVCAMRRDVIKYDAFALEEILLK
jgi:hypothetical protein